jgi:(4S)-4-hydroxy-5-phosphonooxypentane-2,3-dione isomerase
MEILLVQVHVKPEDVEAFRAATIDNARESAREPGIARFDCAQREDDPTRFVLVEVYRSREANAAHRETAHYRSWRAAVESMMAEPRVGAWHQVVFPADEAW